MLIQSFLFIIGFYILIKGANILINGSASLAKIFNVSPWVIGLVIVGIGTSIPELSITMASLWQEADLGLGVIVGSNTFNILVILGIVSLISPVVMKKVWVKQDFVFNVLTLGGATWLAFYPVLGDPAFVGITLEEGVLLLIMFGVWLWYMLYRRRGIDMVDEDEESGYRTLTLSLSIIMIIAGIVGVFVGGHWVVTGGLALAGVLGLSSGLVGLTIVGIGTSLPELTVSVAAIYRRQGSIAVGNIIGSAIFDFLAIFGVAALFTPLTFSTDLQFDILITFVAAILLLGAMFVGRRYILTRWQGFLFLVVYLVYLFYILYRG